MDISGLRQAAAEAKAIYASIAQAASASGKGGPGAGGAPGLNAQANAAQKAADASLALARQQANLARASGDTSKAQQILKTALDNTTGASERASLATQTQLARYTNGTGIIDQFKKSIGALGLSFGALALVREGAEMTQLGASAQQARTRFDQLSAAAGTTGEALLKALKTASAGTISDLNLELAANRAQLLGVAHDAQTFARLMAIARDSAQSLGTTTTQAFDDLVLGLGRGSPKILDNLGIIISEKETYDAFALSIHRSADSLTEAEKKTAILNAVLKQGEDKLKLTGGALESNVTKLERLSVLGENLKASLGGGLADTIAPLADNFTKLADAVERLPRSTNAADVAQHNLFDGLSKTISPLDSVNRGLAELARIAENAAPPTDRVARAIQRTAGAIRRTAGAMAQLAPATILSSDAADRHTFRMTQAGIVQDQLRDETTRLTSAYHGATIAERTATQSAELLSLKTQILRNQEQEAADAFLKANPRITEAGIRAKVAAGLIPAMTGELALLTIQIRAAKAELTTGLAKDVGGDGAQKLFATQQDAIKKARQDQVLATGTEKAKLAVLRDQEATARSIFGIGSAQAIEAHTAVIREQQSIAAASARTATGHTSELGKQLNLQESIRDSLNAQYHAQLDAAALAIRDRQDRRKEDRELAAAQRILASPTASSEFKAAAADKIALINVERQQRAADIADKTLTAGGSIINGKVFQGKPGAGVRDSGFGGASGAGGSGPTNPGSPTPNPAGGGGLTVQFVVNGHVIAQEIYPDVVNMLHNGLRATNNAGGGRAP